MYVLHDAWGMHGGGIGWWIFGAVWMVLFWGAIIGFVGWAVIRLGGGRRRDEDSPLDIARRRYAQGEIGRDEFEQLRRDLA